MQYKTANPPGLGATGSAFKSKSPDLDMGGGLTAIKQQQKTLFVIPKNNIKRDTKNSGMAEEWKHSHEFSEENVREDEDVEEHQFRIRESDSQKKNLKEIARKLWLAVEVGDKLGSLKILKS